MPGLNMGNVIQANIKFLNFNQYFILFVTHYFLYRTECFCGNETPEWGLKLPDSFCNMECPGNPSQMCGGHYSINIFKTGVSS